jgi:hypothetical protein
MEGSKLKGAERGKTVFKWTSLLTVQENCALGLCEMKHKILPD